MATCGECLACLQSYPHWWTTHWSRVAHGSSLKSGKEQEALSQRDEERVLWLWYSGSFYSREVNGPRQWEISTLSFRHAVLPLRDRGASVTLSLRNAKFSRSHSTDFSSCFSHAGYWVPPRMQCWSHCCQRDCLPPRSTSVFLAQWDYALDTPANCVGR